jgi:hypothetical protein
MAGSCEEKPLKEAEISESTRLEYVFNGPAVMFYDGSRLVAWLSRDTFADVLRGDDVFGPRVDAIVRAARKMREYD